MLVRCLYASRFAKTLSAEALDSILAQSSRKNPTRGITGLLCFTNDLFVQVLEGGRDPVCDLYNAIVRDERHVNVRLLSYEETSERRFGNWTMGQVNIQEINTALILKYSETPRLDPFHCSGRATMALLDDLIATGAISNGGS